MAKKHSYFELILDKSGTKLKEYLDEEKKDPPPWELCQQLIEKSLAIAIAASSLQATTESELKIYEAQRIWQPLCLAMTVMSHLKWDLDVIQQHIPLHLQQILMEELLKGYCMSQVPKPEEFDINKFGKRAAMVHIIYNRWVVRTITKYEELKERDFLPNIISNTQRELKENQEHQIFMKVKEYRHLSVDILEKAILLSSDIEVPLPRPRLVTATEIIPTDNKFLIKQEEYTKENSNEKMEVESNSSMVERKEGITMKVPDILDIEIPVSMQETILKICIDLGCYYFPKELYSDASRVFQKAFEIINESNGEDLISTSNYKKLQGYHNACHHMVKEIRGKTSEIADLCYRLEESSQNEYKDIITVLKEDNLERNIPYSQRLNIEKELYLLNKKDDLFSVCTLNFIRRCLDNQLLSVAYFQSLNNITSNELKFFVKSCTECMGQLTTDSLKNKLQDGVRLATHFMTENQKKVVVKEFSLITDSSYLLSKKARLKEDNDDDSEGCIDDDEEKSSSDEMQDERISALVQLKSKLSKCYEPETIKDILYGIHELLPEKSHAAGYEYQIYQDIFQEIEDLLMFDTVHVCVTKAKQLTLQKEFPGALCILNKCVETLNSYATRVSPGCSVSRVKNLLHHELLWTELKYAECDPERANLQETMRRSKACVQHSQQDPPPYPHIYQAIIIHLLNKREFQFLVDAGINFDTDIVDYIQFGYHVSSVICGLQRGVEVLRNAAKGLWDCVLRAIGVSIDQQALQQGSASSQTASRARGPLEGKHMWNMQCFINKSDFIYLILQLKDDTILSLLLSCLASLLSTYKKTSDVEIKDTYSHLWPTSSDSSVTTNIVEVLSILKPLCGYCLQKNSRNISWLRTIGDIYLVEGNYRQAMRCYLEVGSITTSFFSRPVPYSVWDEKIYRNMILCCEKQKAYTQVIVLSQFLEPVDHSVAFKAIQERASDDGMDAFYDCLWDVNILEYLIYAHDKRGEVEKKKIAVKTIGHQELNCRNSPELLQQSRGTRKTNFLRALTRMYWT